MNILGNIPEYIQRAKCDTTAWTVPFKCAVASCQNLFYKYDSNKSSHFKFHNFPNEITLRNLWLERCSAKETDIQNLKVCTDHFVPDDYERNFDEEIKDPNFKQHLKSNAVPSQCLGRDKIVSPDFINAQKPLNVQEVQATVDKNIRLQEKVKKLKQQHLELSEKKNGYDVKLTSNKHKLQALKKKYHLLNKKAINKKESKNLLATVFSHSQLEVLLGKKKVFWSDDDLAKAFTFRHMGSRECYLYLKYTLNYPLPSLSCVQKWSTCKSDLPIK